jgi:hypothetical protein
MGTDKQAEAKATLEAQGFGMALSRIDEAVREAKYNATNTEYGRPNAWRLVDFRLFFAMTKRVDLIYRPKRYLQLRIYQYTMKPIHVFGQNISELVQSRIVIHLLG